MAKKDDPLKKLEAELKKRRERFEKVTKATPVDDGARRLAHKRLKRSQRSLTKLQAASAKPEKKSA